MPLHGLSEVEQAAWEEIMTRASSAEVICIIRPKEPGGQSEVITLEDVSPEFARALAARQACCAGTHISLTWICAGGFAAVGIIVRSGHRPDGCHAFAAQAA